MSLVKMKNGQKTIQLLLQTNWLRNFVKKDVWVSNCYAATQKQPGEKLKPRRFSTTLVLHKNVS